MNLSNIAQQIPASPIRKLVVFAEAAKKKGTKVYHLNIGDPDIKTPDVMINALSSWGKNPISYSNSQGEKSLLESLQWYYQKIGLNDITEKNIQVTLGGSEGLMWAFLTVCNPGDEILTFEPLYANYISYAVMTQAKLVPILTTIDTGFHLPNRQAIESKITPKTKAILICNPSNPTGTVYTPEEMELLLDIAKKNNLFILSDEVYREFVYGGKKTQSFLTYADQYREGIIVVDSLSKRYSLCGARIGALVSYNEALMDSFLKYGQARLSAGFIDQNMAAELKNVPDQYFSDVVSEYEARRNTLVEGLRSIPGVVCPNPEGAFYIIAKLPVDNAEAFAKYLLTDFTDNNETVMVAPAQGFYHTPQSGMDEIRIAYVLNQTDLKRSVEILRGALTAYNKKN